jgi:putative endonuclease
MKAKVKIKTWSVYLLRCGDGTLYCGIALDAEARLEAHRCGKGAKYTKGRGPLELVHVESHPDKSTALRREREIKRMDRAAKLQLMKGSI